MTKVHIGWAKKLDHFLELITLQRLVAERHVICQKFANFARKSVILCMSAFILSLIGHARLTHSYLLSGGDQPTCSTCGHPLTVRHILLDCVDLQDV